MTKLFLFRFVVYVNGKHIITDIILNDDQWHFVCVCWSSKQGLYEIYVDGALRDSGIHLSPNATIEANGTLIIGQEQVVLLKSQSNNYSLKKMLIISFNSGWPWHKLQ